MVPRAISDYVSPLGERRLNCRHWNAAWRTVRPVHRAHGFMLAAADDRGCEPLQNSESEIPNTRKILRMRKRKARAHSRLTWAASVFAVSALASGAQRAVDGQAIAQADRQPGNWLSYGRTYSEQRFSPLKRIDTQNVRQLGLAWSADVQNRLARVLEATPIMIDG